MELVPSIDYLPTEVSADTSVPCLLCAVGSNTKYSPAEREAHARGHAEAIVVAHRNSTWLPSFSEMLPTVCVKCFPIDAKRGVLSPDDESVAVQMEQEEPPSVLTSPLPNALISTQTAACAATPLPDDSAEAPQAKSGVDCVQLRVFGPGFTSVIRVKMSVPMAKLKRAYTERIGLRTSAVCFIFNGKDVNDEDTPQTLNMEDDDVVVVVYKTLVRDSSSLVAKLPPAVPPETSAIASADEVSADASVPCLLCPTDSNTKYPPAERESHARRHAEAIAAAQGASIWIPSFFEMFSKVWVDCFPVDTKRGVLSADDESDTTEQTEQEEPPSVSTSPLPNEPVSAQTAASAATPLPVGSAETATSARDPAQGETITAANASSVVASCVAERTLPESEAALSLQRSTRRRVENEVYGDEFEVYGCAKSRKLETVVVHSLVPEGSKTKQGKASARGRGGLIRSWAPRERLTLKLFGLKKRGVGCADGSSPERDDLPLHIRTSAVNSEVAELRTRNDINEIFGMSPTTSTPESSSADKEGEKDWENYEKARKLKDHVHKIREDFQNDFKAREMAVRQRAVAVYLIDRLALRAGNEKEEGETADTVGCCSLRVEHIKLHDNIDGKDYVVDFDFLGEDSIRYLNRVAVEKRVYKNLKIFLENKTAGDDLFDRLNTSLLSKYLQSQMDGLTAKVFRTYNASFTLQQQLDELTKPEMNVNEKILAYNRANRQVALLCNHQRVQPKTFDKQMETLNEKIAEKTALIKAAKKEKSEAENAYKELKTDKHKNVYDQKKQSYARLKDQLKKLELQATDKMEDKEIALGTSQLNYLDPRISIAWCKKHEVPIEKIYSKTQREKFHWAIDMATKDYHF